MTDQEQPHRGPGRPRGARGPRTFEALPEKTRNIRVFEGPPGGTITVGWARRLMLALRTAPIDYTITFEDDDCIVAGPEVA